ncbi:hypothetical protein G9A89_006234 [Geosiphon pyriformis]|nr:hypothetical protein G9A89_006234 [Geosiphon pyriformis]
MCGHFKSNNITLSMPLIDFEKEKPKLTWEMYQVSWANVEHNKLPPILDWEERNNVKRKETETEEHTCETTINIWNNDDERKGKEKEEDLSGKANEAIEKITIKKSPYILLKCQDCKKKLSSMEAWIMPDEDYWTRTHYYCKPCHKECYNNKPCLACGEQLLDEEMWNDIPAAWHQAISRLEVEDASPSEILEIKNNFPEPTNIVLVLNPDAFLNLENSPEEFHEHYQNLALIRKKQKQRLKEINT